MNGTAAVNGTRPVLRQALLAHKLGICVVPTRGAGIKAPIGEWKEYQQHLPSLLQLRSWFTDQQEGLGVVTGSISGNLEALDFDTPDMFDVFCEILARVGHADLIDRISAGYKDKTPHGNHLFYRCSVISGNVDLAKAYVRDESGAPVLNADGSQKVQALIQTRGEGGFLVVPPSHGHTHPEKKPYLQVSGGLDSIVTITPEEREILFSVARSLSEIPREESSAPMPPRDSSGTRPGDRFAAVTDWPEILAPHGWTPVYARSGVTFWRRPGKDIGISATTNYAGSDLFYVFTSSTLFNAERAYGKFSVYTALDHHGDFQAAAQALRDKGFGTKSGNGPVPEHEDEAFEALLHDDPAPTDDDEPISLQGEDYHLTDLGNSERFIDQHGSAVRYCNPWKKWVMWDSTRWLVDDLQSIKRLAKATVRSMFTDAASRESAKKRKRLIQHAFKSESHSALSAMLTLAQMSCPITPSDMDANPWVFNVTNGTIDLRTGLLGPHVQAMLITKITPILYDSRASAPQWEDFLDRTFAGNQELLTWLQRAIGYSLTGDTREQNFFLCYGSGSNGKSTFLSVLRALLGEYAEQASFETFLQVRNETVRNDLAKLQSCRFVSAIEAEEGRRLSESLIKQLTGGDPISTRFLFGEYFTYQPQFKIWLATNHKPEIRGTDHAMWRRVKLIPFLSTISEEERDEELTEKLKTELPGILAWAVRGCLEWQARKLTPAPEIVQMATAAYQQEQDMFGNFIADCCLLDASLTVPSTDLYLAYKTWCEINSERCVTQAMFAKRLKEKKFVHNRNTLTGRAQWGGLCIRTTDNTV